MTWDFCSFISAHLAAHDENLATRNANYRQILASLLFTPSSSLDKPLRVWQTSHLIFLGDLNYRLATPPTGLDKALIDTSLQLRQGDVAAVAYLAKERERLVALDTLKQQQTQGKAFAFLSEGELTNFAPTYKRIVGQVDGYNKKRRPGYTDRILFASYRSRPTPEGYSDNSAETSPLLAESAGGDTDVGSQARIVTYDSIPDLTVSDHKPVYAFISIPAPSHDAAHQYSSQHQTPLLSLPTPYTTPATDALSLGTRKAVATATDRIVGLTWYGTVTLGAGNLMAGIAVEVLLLIVGLTWWMGLW